MGSRAPQRFMVLGRHGVLSPDQARTQARAILGSVAARQDPAMATRSSSVTAAGLAQAFTDEHVAAKRKGSTGRDYAALFE